MNNMNILLLLYIIYLQIVKCLTIEVKKLPLKPTDNFHSFFIRKINSNKFYCGNFYEEYTIDISSSITNKINNIAHNNKIYCSIGSYCPQIITENNEGKFLIYQYYNEDLIRKYYINDKTETLLDPNGKERINIITFNYNNKHYIATIKRGYFFFTKRVPINIEENFIQSKIYDYYEDYTWIFIHNLTVYESVVSQSDFSEIRQISMPSSGFTEGEHEFYGEQNTIGSLFALSNGVIIIFDMYPNANPHFFNIKIYFSEYNYNLISSEQFSIRINELYAEPFYINSAEILSETNNIKVISCYLSIDKRKIYCFSYIYNGNKLINNVNNNIPIEIISSCSPTNNNERGFSIYKIEDNYALISCVGDYFIMKKVNFDLTQEGPSIIIKNNIYNDFTVLDTNKFIFAYVQLENEKYNYYYIVLYFPSCIDKEIFNNHMDQFYFKNLFMNEDSERNSYIIFPTLNNRELKGKICNLENKNDCFHLFKNQIKKNIEYPIENIYYISKESVRETIDYITINKIPFSSENFISSKICSLTITTCSEGCNGCINVKTETNDNCISCHNENKYYLEETTSSSKCIYHDYKLYIDNTSPKTLKKCYETCLTCLTKGTSFSNQKCNLCDIENGYYYPSTEITDYNNINCVTQENENAGYYFNKTNNNEKVKCPYKCSLCSYDSVIKKLCIKCNIEEGYYPFYNNDYTQMMTDCYSYETKKNDWFLDEETNEYRKCYNTCQKCNKEGNKINHNCNENQCKSEFIVNPIDKTKCECEFYHYINENNEFICVDKCNDDYPYLIRESNECIEDCLLTNDYNTIYNNQCYKNCPEGTYLKEGNYCMEKYNECAVNEEELNYDRNFVSDRINIYVRKYNDEFIGNDHVKYYTNDKDDYSLIIYKNEECIDLISDENFVKVDVKKCINTLRNYYKINENIPLIIVNMNKKRYDESPNQVSLAIYNSLNLKSLNIKLCYDEGIETSINYDGNIDLAKEMNEKGIDIFNINDKFFTDICYRYTSEEGNDMILMERIHSFYQNVSLCDEGCYYNGINLETKIINCLCKEKDFSFKNSDGINYGKKPKKIDINSIVDVVKCFKKGFKTKLFENLGHEVIMYGSLLQLIFVILYFKKDLKLMTENITYIMKSNPPLKTIKEENSDDKNKKTIKINTKKNSLINAERNKKNSERSLKDEDNSLKYIGRIDNEFLSQDINSKNQLKIKEKNYENEEELYFLNLDILNVFEAKKKDKRNFCEFYFYIIRQKQTFIHVFCDNNPFEPKTIKIDLYIFRFIYSFIINGILYNLDYISKKYLSKEKNSFKFLMKNGLLRLILSSIIEFIFFYLIHCFLNIKRHIYILESKEKKISKKKRDYLNFFNNLKIKNVIVIFSIYLINFLSWFFLVSLCYVYKSIQKDLLISSIFTFILVEILLFAFYFIISAFRFIGINLQIAFIYKVSMFFTIF